MVPSHLATGHLTIDLGALARNWRRLDGMTGTAATAAVMKADAYGLGIDRAAPALWRAGCRHYFTAHVSEGIALRADLPEAEIFVLNGPPAKGADALIEAGLVPVLNDLAQIETWHDAAQSLGRALPAAIHIDSGMTRLGLIGHEVDRLRQDPALLAGIDIRLWLTHPACADQPDHPMNVEQLALFHERLAGLPPAPLSAANSAAIGLGADWHFDLCRPGVALYGSKPEPLAATPMEEVVRLEAEILRVSEISRPRTVGYGATEAVAAGRRIATCGVGYADGYLRALSNKAYGVLDGHRVPLVGRVSMDLITFDVTDVPEEAMRPGRHIALIGGGVDIDELAALGGTIAYELLTGLGERYARHYLDGVQA